MTALRELTEYDSYGIGHFRADVTDEQIRGAIDCSPDASPAVVGLSYGRDSRNRLERAYRALTGHGYRGWVTGS